jgi:hypothetical protein
MTEPLVPAWTTAQKADFRKKPMTFQHALMSTGLFEDEALARLMDDYPAELYDINLFDFEDGEAMKLRTGSRGKGSGRELLAACKEGRIWVQLRRVTTHRPEFRAAADRLYADLTSYDPAFKTLEVNAQLLLSAPGAKVPYHVDAPGVILFHLRGRKRLWVYPAEAKYLPREAMEDIVMQQKTEDLPYRRAMDADAVIIDLEPGEAAAWPLHAPHRVENLDGFNVSLTTDYQTWESRFTNGAYYVNGALRRMKLPVPDLDRTPMAVRAAQWAASVPLKRSGLVKNKLKDFERSFELGSDVPA